MVINSFGVAPIVLSCFILFYLLCLEPSDTHPSDTVMLLGEMAGIRIDWPPFLWERPYRFTAIRAYKEWVSSPSLPNWFSAAVTRKSPVSVSVHFLMPVYNVYMQVGMHEYVFARIDDKSCNVLQCNAMKYNDILYQYIMYLQASDGNGSYTYYVDDWWNWYGELRTLQGSFVLGVYHNCKGSMIQRMEEINASMDLSDLYACHCRTPVTTVYLTWNLQWIHSMYSFSADMTCVFTFVIASFWLCSYIFMCCTFR